MKRHGNLEAVKIDRSLVVQMTDDPEIAAIVGAILDLAHTLPLDVVAEGVGTADQLALKVWAAPASRAGTSAAPLKQTRCRESSGVATVIAWPVSA